MVVSRSGGGTHVVLLDGLREGVINNRQLRRDAHLRCRHFSLQVHERYRFGRKMTMADGNGAED